MHDDKNRQVDVRRLQAAHGAFVALCSPLSPVAAECAGACGAWSVRAVAAHLAGWDGEAARRFAELTVDPTNHVRYAVDAFNAHWVSERAALSWAETLADLNTAYARLVAAAQAVPEPRYRQADAFHAWMAGRATDYAAHTQEIAQWLRERQEAHE